MGGGVVAVGTDELGGLEVGVPPPAVVGVGGLAVAGGPTGFGGGVSLPLTLPPESLVNNVPRQSPGCTGAWPRTAATLSAKVCRPLLVR